MTRLYEVEGGSHFEGLYGQHPDLLRPMLPCFREAFGALEQWTQDGKKPPRSHLVAPRLRPPTWSTPATSERRSRSRVADHERSQIRGRFRTHPKAASGGVSEIAIEATPALLARAEASPGLVEGRPRGRCQGSPASAATAAVDPLHQCGPPSDRRPAEYHLSTPARRVGVISVHDPSAPTGLGSRTRPRFRRVAALAIRLGSTRGCGLSKRDRPDLPLPSARGAERFRCRSRGDGAVAPALNDTRAHQLQRPGEPRGDAAARSRREPGGRVAAAAG